VCVGGTHAARDAREVRRQTGEDNKEKGPRAGARTALLEVVTAMSSTQTELLSVTSSDASNEMFGSALVLKLRARKRRVRWAEGVEDNEDLCRKKSKCCCVFHRPRAFDESSSDDEEADEGKRGDSSSNGAGADGNVERNGGADNG
jgi:hypothetical protein